MDTGQNTQIRVISVWYSFYFHNPTMHAGFIAGFYARWPIKTMYGQFLHQKDDLAISLNSSLTEL